MNFVSNGEMSGESFVDFPPTEVVDPSISEYGQCALRGYLYKKERFMTWVKHFCIIRNNFLECHKSHGDSCNPSLKLFLPGSEVKEGGGDAKKKWAFQVSSKVGKAIAKCVVLLQPTCYDEVHKIDGR